MTLMAIENQTSLISVLFAGSHDLLRESLANLMLIQTDMKLVGNVTTNRNVVEQAAILQPDVILIDLSIAEMESLTPIEKIHQAYPDMHIIAMSGFPRKELVDKMLEAGVQRYIKRGDSAQSIVKAIRDVCRMAKEE